MREETVGFALCGSFCTFGAVFAQLEQVKAEFRTVIPIMSAAVFGTDTRFGSAQSFRERAEAICDHRVLHTLDDVEPIGPKKLLDLLIIAPCTGNTAAKLAHGIADSSVTLACKAHLRNSRPVVIGISTNDGLAGNAASIGQLMNRRNFYFVPFGQDDPTAKPTSLVAKWEQLLPAAIAALEGRQLQPLLR